MSRSGVSPEPQPNRSRAALAALLCLVTLSGASSLAHEFLWTRRMIDLLGASGDSTARVFGCFFLGLALGSALATRRGITHPFRLVALCELGIALLAWPIATLGSWTAGLWPALGPEELVGATGAAIKLALSVALVTPPAILMGLVLPCVVRGGLEGDDLGRQGLWLYGANTLGGCLGLVVAALVLLPSFGVAGSIGAVAATNLVAAGVAAALSRQGPVEEEAEPESREAASSESGPLGGLLPIAGTALFSGAAVLAVEVVGIQMIGLGATTSFYTPAAILASVVLTLGFAAFAAPALANRLGGAASALPPVIAVAGVLIALGPEFFMGLSRSVLQMAPAPELSIWLGKLVLLALLSLGPGLFVAGLVFPLASIWLTEVAGRDASGRWGWMLAVNGVGGIAGAELGHRLLFPAFGAYVSLGAIGIACAIVAGILALRAADRPTSFGLRMAAPALGLVATAFLAWGPLGRIPHVNPYAGFEVVQELRGREGVLSVVDHPGMGRALLFSNQYVLGSSVANPDQERLAHLALVLHPAPTRVGFLGLATGSTLSGALQHAAVEQATAIELSPLVAEAAGTWFAHPNGDFTRDDRAEIVIEDARTYIAASPARFDVVIGDLFLPWGPGEARLYSKEHFQAVKDALVPGGLYCQWLAMYQLTPAHFELIGATFAEVFGPPHLFHHGFKTEQPTLALCGFNEGELDWSTVEKRTAALRAAGRVRDPVARHVEGVGLLYLGRASRDTFSGPVATLADASLELDAGRERVTGQPGRKYYFGTRWLSFLTERSREREQDEDEIRALRALGRLGGQLSQWEEANRIEHEKAEEWLAGLAPLVPSSIRSDSESDSSLWPGDARMLGR